MRLLPKLFHAICLFYILFFAIYTPANAQIMESRSVKQKAVDSPEWMVESAKADDFHESAESALLETLPYTDSALGRATTTGPVCYQPAGALSGKIVFAMAGHGWTYDSEEMYYYTQRGLSHGMVEDLGNADQMHIFAHMALNAGATVVPFRPVDHQPEERIIDNTMPQVELFGEWKNGSSDRYFGPAHTSSPYAVAKADLQESAVARFRPYIPVTGYYPVYVWARDGADRSNQLYRVAYAGGIAEQRVNWKRVGKTWVWLGTYYFEAGTSGYVETSNHVIDPYEAYNGHVVIADAVRFGNGMGDVPRPGGVSGFSREDEGDSYWIEQALGNKVNRNVFDAGADGNSTVSSPPKSAAYTNREAEGSFLDRILISFHSNASSGKARGGIALYNAKAEQRPTYQEGLAETIGQELNNQLSMEKPPAGITWIERERNTYSGINFGELRRDYLQNEMCATIVETAFHDNAEDAAFMLNPVSRMHMAQATLRGILRWYSEIVYPNSPYTMPPSRPVALAAKGIKNGKIAIKYKAGSTEGFNGGAPVNLKVYRSLNGFGFDGGIAFPVSSETIEIDPLTTNGTTFIRVTAANAAGESFPSQTIAVGLSSKPDSADRSTLLIASNNILDKTTNIPYYLGKQPGGPYKESSYTQRVRAIYNLMEPTGYAEAIALGSLGIAFDGADSVAVESGMATINSYKRVFLCYENQNPADSLIPEKVSTQIRSLLNRDGKVCVTGSGIISNLLSGTNREKSFAQDVLGIIKSGNGRQDISLQSLDDRFYSTTSSLSLKKSGKFWADEQIVVPSTIDYKRGRSLPLISMGESQNESVAILTRPFYSEGEVITVGFPLSLLSSESQRTTLMKAILKQM